MRSAEARMLSLAVAAILLLSAVQLIPVTTGVSVSHDATGMKPMPGFNLKGALPDDLSVLVSIEIPFRNIGLLSSMVKQVSDPTSPLFDHYPSQQVIEQDFYPTQEFNELMGYISTTGLNVQYTALDSTIVLQGTAEQVRQAFGTDLDVFSNGTTSYYASSLQSFMGGYFFASNESAVELRTTLVSAGAAGANNTFTESSFPARLLQRVYNATALYAKGYNGSGKTVGILDFYGSPTITSDLQAYDKMFGYPNPTFTIIPIGPYAPNLGAFTGWSTEISLDVETSHSMAPGANVDLYIGNGAISIGDAISKIVQDDKVNTLTQSFTEPEWAYAFLGPAFFDANALMPDQYYMMGVLKGITFSGSTGDTGGSGFSNGLEGQLGYPASSPYVTAAGGTQTYFASSSFTQTAWSNLGFVPNFINYGGSTGGISDLEPVPWYQSSQPSPATLPTGRMNPDVGLQAGVDPATYIIDSGSLIGEGGTSESSPLFAGLVTLLDSALGSSVGLLNPFLYSLGNNPATYTKAFTPITFGYNVPWVAAKGYNLVTGWGSPNFGEIYSLYRQAQSQPSLNVTVKLSPGVDSSKLEFTPGTTLTVTATVMSGAASVTTGSFSASLVTLNGTTPISLAYSSSAGAWKGSITMGDQEGLGYVNVQGSSGGISGSGFAPMFAGYFGTFLYPVPTDPWSTVGGLPVEITSTTLDGNASSAASLTMDVDSYSITSNSYSRDFTTTLPLTTNVLVGPMYAETLSQSIPPGPVSFVLNGGTYGYLPFTSGLYLQNTYIYPAVVAEPGSVAPGQELTVVAAPIAPINLYYTTSQETGLLYGQDVASGSNVTAQLLSPSGALVSSVALAYQSCKEALRVCNNGADILNGYLPVPQGSAPGLYTVLLSATYGSETIGEAINGSYYSQVWVSGSSITPSISIGPGFISASATANPPTASGSGTILYESQDAHVTARLSYPNGTAVRFGEYTALVYPHSLDDQYTFLEHTEYANTELVQLTFDPSLQEWLGNVTLPSPSNAGTLSPIAPDSFVYGGPYDVYVTGLSSDGVPTTSALSAQQPFTIQPYILTSGSVTPSPQTSQMAFNGATFSSSGNLSGDLFLGTNNVQGGSLTISDSQIQGNLVVRGGSVTLVGVSGGDVTVNAGALTLMDTSLGTLTMNGGTVSLIHSSYSSISPALPTLSVGGLSSTVTSSATFNVTAVGQGLSNSSLKAWVDGTPTSLQVSSTSSGIIGTGTIDATALNDGIHSLVVTATQSDGLSSTLTTSFATNAKQVALSTQLSSVSGQLNTVAGQLQLANASISSLASQLRQSNATLTDFSIVLAVIALVALIVGVLALRRRPAPPAAPAEQQAIQ